MSVKTLYEYSCDCCDEPNVVVNDRSVLPDGFVGLRWLNAELTVSDDPTYVCMHLCSNCHEALGDLYKREMATKEESEG